MVKMVRTFKPDIMIPTFLDVPGQHGHHRAVTEATISAFTEANDPNLYSDLGLQTWQTNALYLPAWAVVEAHMTTKWVRLMLPIL